MLVSNAIIKDGDIPVHQTYQRPIKKSKQNRAIHQAWSDPQSD